MINTSLSLKRVYIHQDPIWEKLSMIVIVSGSTVYHLRIWLPPSITLYTSKWSHLKLSLKEETHTLKWRFIIVVVSVLNMREAIGFAFIRRANLKGDYHLRNLFNRKRGIFLIIRMPYGVFEVLLELKMINIERFKIFVEVKARVPCTYLE